MPTPLFQNPTHSGFTFKSESFGFLPQQFYAFGIFTAIRGWANYHQSIVAADTFSKVDHVLWQSLWRWAKRRHPNKSSQWVMRKYWHTIGQRSWVFAVDTGDRTPSGQIVWLKLRHAAETKIRRHPQIKGTANPFDPRWRQYFEDRAFLKRFGIHRCEAGIKPS